MQADYYLMHLPNTCLDFALLCAAVKWWEATGIFSWKCTVAGCNEIYGKIYSMVRSVSARVFWLAATTVETELGVLKCCKTFCGRCTVFGMPRAVCIQLCSCVAFAVQFCILVKGCLRIICGTSVGV